ncbi:MAG: response regulator [Proteobacteria bacterium]|nr:response regulator [Pseudomonadota bacterium]
MKIVLIDDSATNLIVLRNLCSKITGSEIVAFDDSEKALEHLLTDDAALIILDYSMPKITGVEVVKRLRASPRHSMTPIVMVTGSPEQAVRRRALEVGVTDFLVKPIKAAECIARLKTLLALGAI